MSTFGASESSFLLPKTRNDGTVGSGTATFEDETETSKSLQDDQAKLEEFQSVSDWDEGEATIPNEIFNLVKNIVGAGGLSLPGAMATFANNWTAVIPSIILMLVMALINAFSFSMLGKVCDVTKSKTYQEAWSRSVGRRYGEQYDFLVGLAVTLKSFLGCWGFSIVIGSSCTPLIHLCGYPGVTKTETIIGITVLVLLPLCMAQRLSSLALFSIVGEIGTLFNTLTMTLRYFDGSYVEGGRFHDDLSPEMKPSFGEKGAMAFFTPQALVLVSILSTGYIAHYNAPKYYHELKGHTTERFNVVVNISFIIAALTYMSITPLGFLTFGENSAGFILDNYSTYDPLATISRFGIAVSVIFAYPLLFLGGRDGLLDLFGMGSAGVVSSRLISLVVLTVVTVLAITIPDLTFVLSFGGATMSSCIIYVFPPLMLRSLVLNCSFMKNAKNIRDSKIGMAMLCLGTSMGICGATVSVIQTFFSD